MSVNEAQAREKQDACQLPCPAPWQSAAEEGSGSLAYDCLQSDLVSPGERLRACLAQHIPPQAKKPWYLSWRDRKVPNHSPSAWGTRKVRERVLPLASTCLPRSDVWLAILKEGTPGHFREAQALEKCVGVYSHWRVCVRPRPATYVSDKEEGLAPSKNSGRARA